MRHPGEFEPRSSPGRTAWRDAAVLLLLPAACAFAFACGSGGAEVAPRGGASAPPVPSGDTTTPPAVEVATVVSRTLETSIRIPGELQPFEAVALYPKVTGFVDWIGVDRGSRVRKSQLVARLTAPEIGSQLAEAEARLQSAESDRVESEAKLASDEDTYARLKSAAETPGVVSGNELETAQKAVEAGRARVEALKGGEEAAKQALSAARDVEAYLQVKAPFDGVVTERNVHPGALVGPASGPGNSLPMVRIEQVSQLRLVAPVPEAYVAGILKGARVTFTVPAFPGESFAGTIERVSSSLDPKTRTMTVEAGVDNASGRLAPGMFPEIQWPVRRPGPTLFVPVSSVVRTTEETFVIRVRDGKAEWVPVKTGETAGGLLEVFGDLREGETVVARGTDEIRPGTRLTVRPPAAK